MSYCWKDGSAELAAGDDLLSSAAALQEVCRMENVVMGLESYDAFCYNAPEPFCLGEGSAFCAPDGKSTSAVTGRSCSPMLVSPLPYFYTEWQALPNASVLLASLERRFAAVDVDGRQHFKPYARTCFARTAHVRRP